MKRNRTIGQSLEELLDLGIVLLAKLLRRALCHHPAVGDDVGLVGDAEHLLHIVGDDDGGDAEGIVELLDELD